MGVGQESATLTIPFEAVCRRLLRRQGWKIRPEWIVWLPGLVSGLNIACRSVGRPGDAVMTATPVYPPFLHAPGLAQRRLIPVPLRDDGRGYGFDFTRIERAIGRRAKLFLLCNPHNPTGRVFSRAELGRLARICLDSGLVICSDEIHCDLVLDQDLRHISLAAIDEGVARRSITLLAPSKTYNIPGLGCSLAVIPDEGLRRGFQAAMQDIVPHVNVLGLTAAAAAYRHGEPWRLALLEHLRGNRDLVEEFVARTPRLSLRHVQATYLAWIDCRKLEVERPAAFFERAGVGLSAGEDFGAPGFVRLNFGCSRRLLKKALARIGKAVG